MSERFIALIPAYEPDEKLLAVIDELTDRGFEAVVVDDGSGTEYKEIFKKASEKAKVVTHKENRGKGAALKTGMSYIYNFMAYSETRKIRGESTTIIGRDAVIVTVDADGQHKAADAMRIAEIAARKKGALVLGSRTFDGDVPARSMAGNTITRHVYSMATGISIRDTQTGLRAFTRGMIPTLLEIDGERYEYEINVLLRLAAAGNTIIEEDIDTIYIEDNKSSHFDTLRDSFRVYREILKFSASSLASFAIDYVMFAILLAVGTATGISQAVIAANIGARLVSATANYTINRKYVFRSNAGLKTSALQYFALASIILLGNTIVLDALVTSLGMAGLPAKLLTEITFFAISWLVQRYVIFYRNEADLDEGEQVKSPLREDVLTERGLLS